MCVKKVSSDKVKLYDLTQVKLKTAGNTQIVQFMAGNNKSYSVCNISKDEYLDRKIGAVKIKDYGTYTYNYEYDRMGNRTYMEKVSEDSTIAEWHRYVYNDSNQLVSEKLYNGKKTTSLTYK